MDVTYPGVYVVEVPSGARPIAGVGTSIAAFVGFTITGPTNTKVATISSFGQFETLFGGLHKESPLSYAVSQFFEQGGTQALIVRVENGGATADVVVKDQAGQPAITVSALRPGEVGNDIFVRVDWAEYGSTFDVAVEVPASTGRSLRGVASSGPLHIGPNGPPSSLDASSQVDLTPVTLIAEGNLTPSTTEAFSRAAKPFEQVDDAESVSDSTIMVSVDGGNVIGVATDEIAKKGLDEVVTELNDAKPADATAFKFAKVSDDGVATVGGGFLGIVALQPVTSLTVTSAPRILGLGQGADGVERGVGSGSRPMPNGTFSRDLLKAKISYGAFQTGQNGNTDVRTGTLTIAGVGSNAPQWSISIELEEPPSRDAAPEEVRDWLISQLRAKIEDGLDKFAARPPEVSGITVMPWEGRIRIRAGDERDQLVIALTGGLSDAIGFDSTWQNPQFYRLGGPDIGAQVAGTRGLIGDVGEPSDLIGGEAEKTGMHALEDADLFNLLCLPDLAGMRSAGALSVWAKAATYCRRKRALLLIDPPMDGPVDHSAVDTILSWTNNLPVAEKEYAALYYPPPRISDPLNAGKLRAIPPCGTVAGVMARTDADRGVFKAPAGTEALLSGVMGFAYDVSDAESGRLNPRAVNTLRSIGGYGRLVWGARTLAGTDVAASEYKYVPVRRLALYIEESLFRGLHWVVFEPNDEQLWAQIRTSAEGFLDGLFRRGAFQGTSAREAFYVKCDAETTTQNDRDLGIVNVEIGFAPLKPAEFVIVRIKQIAGEAAV